MDKAIDALVSSVVLTTVAWVFRQSSTPHAQQAQEHRNTTGPGKYLVRISQLTEGCMVALVRGKSLLAEVIETSTPELSPSRGSRRRRPNPRATLPVGARQEIIKPR
jgi:hypothetical protein